MNTLSPDLIEKARRVDLLALVAPHTPLRRLSTANGGEYGGPCPMCGGKKRFHVQPGRGRWFCRHCTPRWEDAVALQQRLTGGPFREAVLALAEGVLPTAVTCPASPDDDQPPPAEWQARARLVSLAAQEALWSKQGRSARDWLHRRGLGDAALSRWQIGCVPRPCRDDARLWGRDGERPIYLAPGILIPGLVLGDLWYLKVRRLGRSNQKYTQVRGSRPALYMADTISAASTVCLPEGEFDALLLWQLLHAELALQKDVGVATFGSAHHRMAGRWTALLFGRRKIVLYDQDEAGQAGAAWWTAHFPDCRAAHWRDAKDITELYLHNGSAPLRQLLAAAL